MVAAVIVLSVLVTLALCFNVLTFAAIGRLLQEQREFSDSLAAGFNRTAQIVESAMDCLVTCDARIGELLHPGDPDWAMSENSNQERDAA